MMEQITMAIAVTSRAEGKSGKKSANVIPNPAMTARPTNGCRGAPRKFIATFFVHFAVIAQVLPTMCLPLFLMSASHRLPEAGTVVTA
jgi:hypothetical protein